MTSTPGASDGRIDFGANVLMRSLRNPAGKRCHYAGSCAPVDALLRFQNRRSAGSQDSLLKNVSPL